MAEKMKITYATFASPNPEMDRLYDEAVAKVKTEMGDGLARTYPHHINGDARFEGEIFEKISPCDLDVMMGRFHKADKALVDEAVAAAKAAYPAWRDTPYQERIKLLNKAADLISDRVFEIGAILSLEVGKNRLESLGEVEEAADLIRYCTEAMMNNDGFVRPMNGSATVTNTSVLKPFGVWGVISPFNYPTALSAGPAGAALVAGNTVVQKPAEDAPFCSYLIGQCFVDAGLPAGVFNQVFGADETGKAIVANPDVDGITFTGSFDVGMSIARDFAVGGTFARPVILEMGGKNPTIISNKADLDKAALGVMRSSFSFSGQKCSANSRVFVHEDVKTEFLEKLTTLAADIKMGDPTDKDNYIGPVINKHAYENYQKWTKELGESGKIVIGGEVADANGYYVKPTIVTDLPDDSPYWRKELFVPVVKIDDFSDMDEAMERANDIPFGLTAGFFSEDDAEVEWFKRNIQAGVLYINRPAGSTTGAWPGYQAFGGWKGSTGTGKAAGSHYYLQQYMHEQSHTVVIG